ncbi:MAG: type IV pilin N-terminal domain-containing protein [Methanoculleus sp.]
MKQDRRQQDDAISSVVGEMIMITLVIILVALFATSAFSMIPGGREVSVDVVMKNVSGDTTVVFWHKGGDWVEGKDLVVVVIDEEGKRTEYIKFSLFGADEESKDTFDLGGCLVVKDVKPALGGGDIVRLVTQKTVIYSGVIP